MTSEEQVAVLRLALEKIRETTFAEFQDLPPRGQSFNPKKHVCPMCLRGSTPQHLLRSWALIQATAAEALRATES